MTPGTFQALGIPLLQGRDFQNTDNSKSPQVAIVGFGRIVERPWAVDGDLAVRPVVSLSLAADHRARDCHRGGLLAEIDLLQKPESL